MTASSARTHMGSRALSCTTGSLQQIPSLSRDALQTAAGATPGMHCQCHGRLCNSTAQSEVQLPTKAMLEVHARTTCELRIADHIVLPCGMQNGHLIASSVTAERPPIRVDHESP